MTPLGVCHECVEGGSQRVVDLVHWREMFLCQCPDRGLVCELDFKYGLYGPHKIVISAPSSTWGHEGIHCRVDFFKVSRQWSFTGRAGGREKVVFWQLQLETTVTPFLSQ